MKKIVILLLFIVSLSADQLKVPSAYSTIQAGLNAASSGDTVLVAAGTYTENIFWPDVNGIKLISAGDSSNTIIDGGGTSSVIHMNPSSATIDTTTLIQGFKITNGGGVSNGGGLNILVAAKVSNCLITKNEATYSGGGIYLSNAGIIRNSKITDNKTTSSGQDYGGGGIYLGGSSKAVNCIITNNYSYGFGGGAFFKNGTISYSEIRNNTAGSDGEAIGNREPSTNVIDNTKIIGHQDGIAVMFWSGGTITISNSKFIENNSALSSSAPQSLTISNSDFIRNKYYAISTSRNYPSGSTRNISNCNFIENNAYGGNTTVGISNLSNYTSSSVFVNSNFVNKNNALINYDNSKTITAINNYWGDSSGPYHPSQNTSGKGDSVNAFVNVDPWLTAPNTDAPPIPAQNLKLDSQTVTSATFSWDASKIGDLAGYKFYYDTDSSGYPYVNSVDLGNVVTKSLTGLTAGKTYYVAVSTYDTDGNESWYSKEVSVTMNNTPVIAAVSDVTMNEDESSTITLSATDVENDAITFSAVSDTNAVTTSISSSTLTLIPTANWNGVANIKAYASDGSSKDSTSFKLTVTPVNDAPTAFEWVSIALDTVNITQSNLAETYTLQWSESEDVDGDTIDYLVYAKIGVYPAEEISDTTSLSVPITYQEILEGVFEGRPVNGATVRFNVKATDGIDTVDITGDNRVIYVNRYEYLSTEGEGVPVEFALHENYPNPFNPTTTLRFDLPEVSNVTVVIFNMLGQKVRTFNMNDTPAGYHSVKWNATNNYGDPVGAGIYFYQLQTKDFVKTRKMVLLK